MGFWEGLVIGVVSAVIGGLAAIVGVILTNRAATARDAAAQHRDAYVAENAKRSDREHELRGAITSSRAGLRRMEARYERGLLSAGQIDLSVSLDEVSWRVGRLSAGLSTVVEREFARAVARIEAGDVDGGIARLDALMTALQKWALYSAEPLLLPSSSGPDG